MFLVTMSLALYSMTLASAVSGMVAPMRTADTEMYGNNDGGKTMDAYNYDYDYGYDYDSSELGADTDVATVDPTSNAEAKTKSNDKMEIIDATKTRNFLTVLLMAVKCKGHHAKPACESSGCTWNSAADNCEPSKPGSKSGAGSKSKSEATSDTKPDALVDLTVIASARRVGAYARGLGNLNRVSVQVAADGSLSSDNFEESYYYDYDYYGDDSSSLGAEEQTLDDYYGAYYDYEAYSSALGAEEASSTTMAPPTKAGTPKETNAGTEKPPPEDNSKCENMEIMEKSLTLHDVMSCDKGERAMKTTSMTQATYETIFNTIDGIMQKMPLSGCNNNQCPRADFAGCVLRAAGHDFMDFRAGSGGGSDGCILFNDPDNKGLINCINGNFDLACDVDPNKFTSGTLFDAYQPVCDTVSLADFMVIAAETVMALTRPAGKGEETKAAFINNFKFGRATNTKCDFNPHLPSPHDGCEANVNTFMAEGTFGLNWRQVAALMGVHTLGKTHIKNSGYSGWWTDKNNVASFTNNYYISIVNKGWAPHVVEGTDGTKKSEWIRSDLRKDNPRVDGLNADGTPKDHLEMMLNTDMCLAFKDVKAETSNCCAWERFPNLEKDDIKDTLSGEPIFCGFKKPFASFVPERDWCCFGPRSRNDDGNTASNQSMFEGGIPLDDCGGRQGPGNPDGPALKDVHEFASSDDKWITEFLNVWSNVTEKGAVDLQALR